MKNALATAGKVVSPIWDLTRLLLFLAYPFSLAMHWPLGNDTLMTIVRIWHFAYLWMGTILLLGAIPPLLIGVTHGRQVSTPKWTFSVWWLQYIAAGVLWSLVDQPWARWVAFQCFLVGMLWGLSTWLLVRYVNPLPVASPDEWKAEIAQNNAAEEAAGPLPLWIKLCLITPFYAVVVLMVAAPFLAYPVMAALGWSTASAPFFFSSAQGLYWISVNITLAMEVCFAICAWKWIQRGSRSADSSVHLFLSIVLTAKFLVAAGLLYWAGAGTIATASFVLALLGLAVTLLTWLVQRRLPVEEPTASIEPGEPNLGEIIGHPHGGDLASNS